MYDEPKCPNLYIPQLKYNILYSIPVLFGGIQLADRNSVVVKDFIILSPTYLKSLLDSGSYRYYYYKDDEDKYEMVWDTYLNPIRIWL